MKKFLIIIGIILLVGIISLASYLKLVLPDVGEAPTLNVNITPERIKHGEYLANHITACMDCHSSRDWTSFSGPISPGTLGKGGEYFGPELGFPGKFYSRNITPINLENWTDGEIFRTITTGVDREGKALFPVMPYLSYGKMDKEDIYDIIAYLRSIPSIDNKTPVSKADFPMNFIINTLPAKSNLTKRPEKTDVVAYGAYLVNAAACMDCHTQVSNGQIIQELAFSGGREFAIPHGTSRSANITPDINTGIGNWTEDAFVQRFKTYTDPTIIANIDPAEFNTIMPWTMFGGMDSTDLKSIYAYLMTLKPIENQVEHFTKN